MAKVALLIGVSEYEPGLNPLPAAVKDVEEMQRVLANPEIGGFAIENIKVLKNPQRQEIEDAIYELFSNRTREDLLLFYFSGHGIKDDRGKLYLSTRTTKKHNGKLVTPSALAASVLHENMNDSRSQRQVIILDCCFSGAIAFGMSVKDNGTINVQEQLGGKGRAILTSSSSMQYSFEQEGSELSIYTRFLVEGIDKGAADKDGDGWISVDELHEYASIKVQEVAPAMTPKFYPVEEGHKILLAKSLKDDPKVKYRREVQRLIHRGKFTIPGRRLLNSLRNQLKLESDVADAIEAEVQKPYQEYQRKLEDYEATLIEISQSETELSKTTLNDLRDYQQHLGLRDEDVAPIEQRIIGQQKSATAIEKTVEQTKKNQSVTESGDDLAQFETNYQVFQPLIQPAFMQHQNQDTQFEFQVVTVNAQGQEIKCEQRQAEYFTENLGNGITLEMVSIPSGTFMMGSSRDELERRNSESPQHLVNIKQFYVGKYLVTQAQWRAVAGLPQVNRELDPDPSYFKGDKRPVESVSWYDAVEFCDRLTTHTKRQYRLPSEAEWEYVCRAGTTTPFHFGETIKSEFANYNANYIAGVKGTNPKQTTEVGSFGVANAFGLYDMHGNVWEWCLDDWHKNYEGAPTDGSSWFDDNNSLHQKQGYALLRGASWISNSIDCRCASRFNLYRSVCIGIGYDFGFRVVSGV